LHTGTSVRGFEVPRHRASRAAARSLPTPGSAYQAWMFNRDTTLALSCCGNDQ
jgi:hypothetical protein